MNHPPPPTVAGIVQRQYAVPKPRHPTLPVAATVQTLFSSPATVGGQTGTLTLTFTPDSAPPPPPPPLLPVLTGFTADKPTYSSGDVMTGQVTLSGPAPADGSTITFNSSSTDVILPPSNLLIRPGLSSGTFSAVCKPVQRLVSVVLYAAYGDKTLTLVVNITPSSLPPPVTDPAIKGYLDGNSSPSQYFAEGSPVRVVGQGFGAAPGTLILAGSPFPVTAWSDTEVVFTAPVVIPPGSTVSTSPWQTVGIVRADRKGYTDQWGVKLQQMLKSPTTTQDADPIPLPWASEPPCWVETQPFGVGGKFFALHVQVKPAPGTAPDPPPAPLPPVVTAPVIAGGKYFRLEVTPVPVQGGPPAASARP